MAKSTKTTKKKTAKKASKTAGSKSKAAAKKKKIAEAAPEMAGSPDAAPALTGNCFCMEKDGLFFCMKRTPSGTFKECPKHAAFETLAECQQHSC